MPLNEVNLGAIKERAEAVLVTPSSTLTDTLVSAKERLMIHHSIPCLYLKFHIRIRRSAVR